MTLRYIVAVGGVLMLVGIAWAWSQDTPQALAAQEAEQLDEVTTVPVQWVSRYLTERHYTGVVKAARTSELGFERSGELVHVAVVEGATVQQGAALARLDTRSLLARQRELSAQRTAAQAVLDELEAGPRDETIDAAVAVVQQRRAELKLEQANLKRNTELVATNAISKLEFDRTHFGTDAAEARLTAAESALAELREGTRPEQIQAQLAMVEQLQASLEQIAVDIDKSVLLAPFSGTISKRHFDEGTIVTPATPLLRLVEDAELEAWIGIPANAAARLVAADQQELLVGQQVVPAEVKTVLPELDPVTRTRTAILRFPATSSTVVPGQLVRLRLIQEEKETGCWLPQTALTRGDRGLWSVYAVKFATPTDQSSGVIQPRIVEVLYTAGDRVLVRGTLNEGEQIVTSRLQRRVPNERVLVKAQIAEDTHVDQ